MKKVIIAGAGVAGISAAVALAEKGHEVVLAETKKNIGGRVFSFQDNKTSELVDNGQHAIIGAYKYFLGLLARFGTDIYLAPQNNLKVPFYHSDGTADLLDTSLLPGKLGMLAGLFKLSKLSLISKLNLILFAVKVTKGNLESDCSALELLKKYNQGVDAIFYFWEPLIVSAMNMKPSDASAELLIEVLKKGFFADSNSARLMLPGIGLSELMQPALKYLSRYNFTFMPNTSVSEVLYSGDIVTGLKLADGEILTADYYILTVPPNVLKKILPEELRNSDYFSPLSDYRFSTIINIYYWLDRYVDTPELGAMTGTYSQWFFNRRKFVQTEQTIKNTYPGLFNITISSANELEEISSEDLSAICFGELQKALPQLKEAKFLHNRVIRDKHATFLATNELEHSRLNQRTPIPNLFIGGDWTDTGLPATIEGAALSGFTCAELLTKH